MGSLAAVPLDAGQVTKRFFRAYADGDLRATGSLLADDVTAYITTAQADVMRVEGREAYMARVPDLGAVGGSCEVTQLLEIDRETTLTMVEIRAKRRGKELHNFAAFLARVTDGQIRELWMVDALPAYSADFWA